jgi:hypothetical protein
MWSTPAITPFATDGAAPRITTNRMADSLMLNSRIASGNHTTDGIDCSPEIREPRAVRSKWLRLTTRPSAVPMSSATA